jgi:hypothetical protein
MQYLVRNGNEFFLVARIHQRVWDIGFLDGVEETCPDAGRGLESVVDQF